MTATSSALQISTQLQAKPTTRALLGFFSTDEDINFANSVQLQLLNVDATTLDREKFNSEFAAARAHVAGLAVRPESGITFLPNHTHLKALEEEPTYSEHGGVGSAQLASIEVEKLAVCQPHVNWSYVEQLIKRAPEPGDDIGLLHFCLPFQKDAPPIVLQPQFSPMSQTLSIVVDSPDYRIICPAVSSSNERSTLGFMVGPGLHQMSVTALNGRYILNNGYHRAVALAARGHKRILVLLKQGSRLDQTPMASPGMFSPQIVLGPTPPRIEDFLSPASVDLPRRQTRLLFTVHAELHPIPP
jgi:hypothetical protein